MHKSFQLCFQGCQVGGLKSAMIGLIMEIALNSELLSLFICFIFESHLNIYYYVIEFNSSYLMSITFQDDIVLKIFHLKDCYLFYIRIIFLYSLDPNNAIGNVILRNIWYLCKIIMLNDDVFFKISTLPQKKISSCERKWSKFLTMIIKDRAKSHNYLESKSEYNLTFSVLSITTVRSGRVWLVYDSLGCWGTLNQVKFFENTKS